MSFVLKRIERYSLISITIFIVVSFFAIIMNFVVMPIYVSQKDMLTVPDLVNKQKDEALVLLQSLQLESVVNIAPFDPKQPPHTIIAQNPFPSTEVKVGRRVYLTVTASEPNKVSVPDLIGKSEREATIMLQRYKLRKGGIAYQESDEFPENVVMNQTIKPEIIVNEGSLVTLIVSRGKPKDMVLTPNLVNLSMNDAQKALLRLGLSSGIVHLVYTDAILPNTITDQFPKAGEKVPMGRPVDLWVTRKGKKPAEPVYNENTFSD